MISEPVTIKNDVADTCLSISLERPSSDTYFKEYNNLEYSFYGPFNRNKITTTDKLSDLIPKKGDEHYACWFRYQPELANYVEAGHDETDKESGEVKTIHSVSGNNFSHYCDYVTWDIDNKDDLEQARKDTAALVGKLNDLGIESVKIGIFFSGSKGFHVLVPSSLFGLIPILFQRCNYVGRMKRSASGDLPYPLRLIRPTIM